jgi:hypothetical protein
VFAPISSVAAKNSSFKRARRIELAFSAWEGKQAHKFVCTKELIEATIVWSDLAGG